MTRYFPLLETRTGLRTTIFGAGMLAVLVLAGATRVVADDGGADSAGIQTAEAAA